MSDSLYHFLNSGVVTCQRRGGEKSGSRDDGVMHRNPQKPSVLDQSAHVNGRAW